MATIYKKYALNMFFIFEDVMGKKRRELTMKKLPQVLDIKSENFSGLFTNYRRI